MSLFTIFNTPDLDGTAREFARNLPSGRAWNNKTSIDSNLYKLIKSCAAAFNTIQTSINELATEMDINLTDDLLPDWEESVGIPDDCVFLLTTLADRRTAVIRRLRKAPVVTKAEFETLGNELTGSTVTVTAGIDFIPAEDRFTMVVEVTGSGSIFAFPLTFPAAFSSAGEATIECVFKKVAPAYVDIVFA